MFESREQPANSARFTFLDPAALDFYPEWDRLASELVANLRSHAGRDPYDRSLQDLIGELSTRSDEFRVRWAAHNVRFHRTGTKRVRHPVVGEIELSYETLRLDADDLRLPTNPAGSEPEDASGPGPSDDRRQAEPSHANPIARARIATGGYIARHPALLKAFEWLGWNNPGGSTNP